LTTATVWLIIFVAAYWSYCIFWGIKGARSAKTASDYFIAGRTIPIWVFVLAATATSFSGWTFMGHPGLVYRDGFQYAYASFYTITIPFTGVMFLKRQWIIGKRFGFVTPGEMFADYYGSEAIRILTVLVAMIFSVPYLGVQLRASGFLFNVLTDGLLGVEAGMWMLSIVVIIYVASGGLRAVAYVDTLQCLLLAFGIAVIGVITLNAAGGWTALNDGIAKLTSPEIIPALGTAVDPKRTAEGYSHYIAIPGVIQFVKAGASAVGGAWTGIMCLTYMFALMGIQSSPAFSMWSFANKNPRPFAPQQVWASSFGIGFILIIFTAIQGLGGHLIGADANALTAGIAKDVLGIGGNIMEMPGKQGMIVPALINLMSDTTPWLVGLLAVCALAAMQSTGAAYMSTAGGMLTRDIYKRFFNPEASHTTQKLFGRMGVVVICGAALVVATTSKDALVLLGGLAVAYGFQMWPALIGICYVPWLTRQGVTWGLFAGLVAVTLTDMPATLGITAWGRWPWTIHCAGWGIFFNAGVAIIISAMTQGGDNREHKQKFHDFLAETASVAPAKQGLKATAWIVTIVWFIFAIGPGAVIGNTIFGNPNDATTWIFSMPSIWAWQIIWWALGVGMMWFLAYHMGMSTMPDKDIVALVEDIGDVRKARLDVDKP
jgi:SSS family solute:Na+ symporter